MRTTLLLISIASAVLLAGCASSNDLGPLSGYYRYDCVGSRGAHRGYVHDTFKRALAGDHAALYSIFHDRSTFGSGDNEAWSELPGIFLAALGDDRYSSFAASQPASIQTAALFLFPEQLPDFIHTYPKTSKLFYARFPRKARNA